MVNSRIAMLIARFYPVLGGAERQALLLAQCLRKMGVGLFVVTARLPQFLAYELVKDVPVYRTVSMFKSKIGSLLFMISSFVFLCFRRSRYEVIQVYLTGSPAIVGVLLGRLFHKKVIVKLGGAGSTGDIGTSRNTYGGTWKINFLKEHVDMFIVPTQEIKRELLQAGFSKEKIELIPNGVDIERFSPVTKSVKKMLREELKLPDGNIVIYTGRLESGKGLEILLNSWREVSNQFPKAYLVIIGEGSLIHELMQMNRSSAGGQVYFLGKTDGISRYVQAADIFVLPSLAEGLSNALLEAMSCGLAVVATNIGGTREIIIDNDNGLLVEPGNALELSKKISSLLPDESEIERLGRKARKTIEDNYRIELVAQRYVEIYAALLAEE